MRRPTMTPVLRLFALLLVAPLAAAQVSGRSTALRPGGAQHTSMTLVADVRSVQPGTTFQIGILLRMDPGWHTYWEYAGEAGLPTTVRWTLPDGLTAGETRWPLPEKQVEEGNLVTFGYGGETMLIVPFTASRSLSPGTPLRITAAVDWLECKTECVPGSARDSLLLPVSSPPALPAHDALFALYRSKLPVTAAEAPEISLTTTVQDHALRVQVRPAGDASLDTTGGLPDIYPVPPAGVAPGHTVRKGDASAASVTLPVQIDGTADAAPVLKGVLVYKLRGGERKGVELSMGLADLIGSSGGPSSGSVLDRPFTTVSAPGTGQPLLVYLALALFGGLLLNIMPCVLPVIALKIFGLVRMAGDQPRQIRRLGWMFSLGVLASFLLLALVVIILKVAGQQVGWGFQFQEPYFVIAMTAVVFAFGLSLFGVFEIQLPASTVTGVGSILARQAQDGGKGYAASFAEGVFATVLATPCTAPFLGTALGFAFSQSAWVVLLIFSVVALGMALPYLILTAKPGWLRYLPKPGEWMVTAKQFMGFLMMATMLWLLYVLGKQLGMEAVIWTGAFLLAIGCACWLVGTFATLSASRRTYALTWVAALLLVGGGYWLFLESALGIRSVVAGTSASSATASTGSGIGWTPFTLRDLDGALKEGKPVFIDFTAEWCLTCKVNERTVLSDQQVIDRFSSSGILPFRADWTSRNPDITQLLAKFGRSGVPLYVVFPAGRPEAPILLPEVITSGMVIAAIDSAVAG